MQPDRIADRHNIAVVVLNQNVALGGIGGVPPRSRRLGAQVNLGLSVSPAGVGLPVASIVHGLRPEMVGMPWLSDKDVHGGGYGLLPVQPLAALAVAILEVIPTDACRVVRPSPTHGHRAVGGDGGQGVDAGYGSNAVNAKAEDVGCR